MNVFFQYLLHPYIRFRLKDVVGTDGVTRKEYFYFGIIWEWHKPGYYTFYYDGTIHNFSFGIVQIYWDWRVITGE